MTSKILCSLWRVSHIYLIIVTYNISRLTPPSPLAVQEMVEHLRSPELDGPPLSDPGEEQLD